ncbi:DnaJ-like protein subfamily C member 11 [Elysia marginata]|uniref:DnaJ-like protein subfamily C member 11 n=1 Tax=Elysia marginata TaxID=1093978 RepID=A0AAV4F596_9GAST|nr:DnaJ-like protein subfamily C member 11 [Elysia marginata]
MAASLEEDDDILKNDYYALLNVGKDASVEEINNAFRHLSKIYHPDKHVDPIKKRKAEEIFNNLRKAHDVLRDKHKRTVYDMYGEKGLETGDMEVIARTKTPQEIIAEYERIQKEKEERRLQQRTNPRGMFSVMWRRLVSDKGWAELDFHFGSALGLGVTGFRQLTQRCYVRCGARADVTQFGYRPSATFMVAYQFDRNIQGRLTYNLARPSSISTNIVYSSEVSNVSSSVQLGVKSSFFSLSCTRTFLEHDAKVRGALRIGTLGSMVECGIEKKVTDFSHIGGTLTVSIPQGVHLKLKMMRGQQTFFFPIYLSDGVSPSAILYGAVVPLASYFVVKKLIINPILKQQKQKELEKQKEEYAEKMAQKKSEAEKAVELMRETFERSIEIEEKKLGLVIIKALYGKLQNSDDGEVLDHQCIDVTIPIQALVKDSKLILPETTSKSGLPGFYDPFIGEEKKLYIRYKFRGRLHQVFLSDTEPIRVPQKKHQMPDEQHQSSPPGASTTARSS